MRDQMASRGPDGSGEWFSDDGRVGPDISASRSSTCHQLALSRVNRDRSLAIIFNGEIYNYRELRAQLLARGCRFESNSDTEVLLHLYSEKAEAMMNYLRGMYAFAIWDRNKQGVFIARDPFGIKPLYYSDNGHTFRLASQVKALRAGGRIDSAPDSAGHVGFFF
jgi:asparagine synthase (glutamine-hydrolysing)